MEAYTTSSDVETCVVALKVICDKCHFQTCSFFSLNNKKLFNQGETHGGMDAGLSQTDVLC